jgi:hypothetical protein
VQIQCGADDAVMVLCKAGSRALLSASMLKTNIAVGAALETNYMHALYQYGFDKTNGMDFWTKVPQSDDSFLKGFR